MLTSKSTSSGICVILKLCNRKNSKLSITKIVKDSFEAFELQKFNKTHIFWQQQTIKHENVEDCYHTPMKFNVETLCFKSLIFCLY